MAASTGERAERVAVALPREGANARAVELYREGLDAADALDLSVPLGGDVQRVCAGRPTLWVRGAFASSDQTCVILVVFYSQAGPALGPFVGHFRATLVGGGTALDGALYTSQPVPFPALAENYEVRVQTPPGDGVVSLYTWEE